MIKSTTHDSFGSLNLAPGCEAPAAHSERSPTPNARPPPSPGTRVPHRVVGVARLDPELGQDPDAVGELEGLVQHVLALHVPLGDGVDVAALQLPRHRVCKKPHATSSQSEREEPLCSGGATERLTKQGQEVAQVSHTHTHTHTNTHTNTHTQNKGEFATDF